MTDKSYLLFAINPGSTSTKIALFRDEVLLFQQKLEHEAGSLPEKMSDQLPYREALALSALREAGYAPEQIDVFVGRGGGVLNLPGGTYRLNELYVRHAEIGMLGTHPAQLAPQICARLAAKYGGDAFTVNPPDTDEFFELARLTGIKGVYRPSQTHALNQKEIAIRYCKANGLKYSDTNLVIVHMGGGISVCAHKKGRIVDSNSILNGDGPMTPTRCGAVPVAQIIQLCFSGKYSRQELMDKAHNSGGLLDWLGTTSGQEIEQRIAQGDELARLVYDSMIYQTASAACARFAALEGDIQQIILTGGMANSAYIVSRMKRYLSWAAPVTVMPGEFEMEALAAGALRVLRGEEEALTYTAEPVWDAPVPSILS